MEKFHHLVTPSKKKKEKKKGLFEFYKGLFFAKVIPKSPDFKTMPDKKIIFEFV
jgi:hypothetical protein